MAPHCFRARYSGRMKIVFASDSFKGSLSSERICALLEEAAAESLPSAECVSLRMADGGEGTLDAISSVRPGEVLSLYVHDGLMRPLRSGVYLCDDEAFVEAAATCGLALLKPEECNPLDTTSYGVGECIGHALHHGCTRIAVGLGGSCTNDGGMGCLRALGMRFYDKAGQELMGRGADLADVASIDESGLFPQVREASFTIMSDVTNPLLGPNGATHVFARQKGATDKTITQLEAGMNAFADVVAKTHPSVDFATPGYGAAGGLGMALSVFLGARVNSGIETLLAAVDFDALIADADLVVTGEGQLDGQSLRGKVISGVSDHAKRAGVPVAAICGRVSLAGEQLRALGLKCIIEAGAGQTIEQAMNNAEENYRRAARELFASLD